MGELLEPDLHFLIGVYNFYVAASAISHGLKGHGSYTHGCVYSTRNG